MPERLPPYYQTTEARKRSRYEPEDDHEEEIEKDIAEEQIEKE